MSWVESEYLYTVPNSLKKYQSQRRRTMDHGCWKSWVFSRRLKVTQRQFGVRSEGGRLFQVAGLSWVELSLNFIYAAELADQSQRRRAMYHGCWKSWVFSRRLKVLSDSSGVRSEGGRLFQVAGSNTAKLRWPVEVRALGKRRVPVVAECSWCLPSTEVTGMHRSARQGSAALYRVDISTPELLSWRWCEGAIVYY